MTDAPDLIVITTTTATKAQASRIAETLIDGRFAACVQTSGPIESRYRWQGKVETADEWLCTIKTTADRYGEVETAIRANHPYEQPEIIATPVVASDPGYAKWVRESTSIDQG
jgi:periplasmic divalent cation tolerance protein